MTTSAEFVDKAAVTFVRSDLWVVFAAGVKYGWIRRGSEKRWTPIYKDARGAAVVLPVRPTKIDALRALHVAHEVERSEVFK